MAKFNYVPPSGRLHWGKHKTRKDFHHTKEEHFWSYLRKKPLRKYAAKIFRLYKGDVNNGNWYRKHFDIPYTLW